MPSPIRQLVSDSAWCLAATLAARCSTLLAMYLAARMLGAPEFGMLVLIQSTVLTAGAFIGIGLGMAATKAVAEARLQSPHAAASVIASARHMTMRASFAAAIGLALGHRVVATHMLSQSGVGMLLLLSTPLLAATAYGFYQQGVLSGLQDFRRSALANAAASACSVPLVYAGVRLGGVAGAVAALTAATGLTCLAQGFAIKRAAHQREIVLAAADRHDGRQLIAGLAVPAVLLQLVAAPVDWLGFACLAGRDNGLAEVGAYGAANQWCQLLRFMPIALGGAMLPKIVQAQASQSGKLLRTCGVALGAVVVATAGCAAVLSVAGPSLVRSYGTVLDGRLAVYYLLLGAACLASVQLTADRILLGMEKVWPAVYVNLARAGAFCSTAMLAWTATADRLAIARLTSLGLHAAAASALIVVAAIRFDRRCAVPPAPHAASPLPDPLAGDQQWRAA